APLTNTSTAPLTTHEDVPVADSSEDVLTRTVPLDGGTAVVEHVGDRVEVTVRIGHRLTAALVLSHDEASALGAAIREGQAAGEIARRGQRTSDSGSEVAPAHFATQRELQGKPGENN